jgi:parallel beta-helix repeat protein
MTLRRPSIHHTRRVVLALGLAVVLLAGLLTAGQLGVFGRADQASAAPNAVCGQTITTNFTLNTDLGPCPDDGLVAGANGITINLGGHTIRGNDQAQLNYGVQISVRSNVTVTNGTIRDFDGGVKVEFGANGNRIQNLRITSNQRDGVYIESGNNNVVAGNVVFAHPAGAGVVVRIGSGNQITNNTLHSNSNGLTVSATSTTVSNNKAASNTARGIGIFTPSAGTVVTNNDTNSNALGIGSDDPTAKFTNNQAHYNTTLGIDAEPGSIDGAGNLAQDNGDVRQCTNLICLPV